MNLDSQSFLDMLIPSLRFGCQNEQWSFCGRVLQRQKAEEGEGGWGLGVGALVFGDDLMTGGKKGRKKTEQVGHDGGK